MNYNMDDTIAAISTPPGCAGIGKIRISGEDALEIADQVFYSSSTESLKKGRKSYNSLWLYKR